MHAFTGSLVGNLGARPDPDGERPINPILHDPVHLADVLDHVHALAQYIENGGAVVWWTGDARGPHGEIDRLLPSHRPRVQRHRRDHAP